jgi:hypothetical protein
MLKFENEGRQPGSVVIDLVELLWSNPSLNAEFVGGKGNWKKEAAAALSVETDEMASAIDAFGSAKLRELVLSNPAGHILWASVPKGGPTRPGDPIGQNTKLCTTDSCATLTCETSRCESGAAACRGQSPRLNMSEER